MYFHKTNTEQIRMNIEKKITHPLSRRTNTIMPAHISTSKITTKNTAY